MRAAVTASVYPVDHLTGDVTGRGDNLTGNLTGERPAAFTVLHRAGPEPLFSLRNSGFTLPMGPNYHGAMSNEVLPAVEDGEEEEEGTMIVVNDHNTSSNNNNNNNKHNNNHTDHYILTAHSVRENLRRLLRAMQLPRPILLEGPPGVGKTSIISNLAKLTGHTLVSTIPLH